MKTQTRQIGIACFLKMTDRGVAIINADNHKFLLTRMEAMSMFFALQEYMNNLETSVSPEVWQDIMEEFETPQQAEIGDEECIIQNFFK